MPSNVTSQHDYYVTSLNAHSSELDIIDCDVVWPAEFAQAEYLVPLDNFIEAGKLDLDMYYKGALEAGRFKGKQWTLPRMIDLGLLFYRTDLVPENAVPKTWEQLYVLAANLKKSNKCDFGYLLQAKQSESLICNAVEFIGAYGGRVVDENGNVCINSKETRKGLEMLKKLVNADFVPQNIMTFEEDQGDNAFIQGQAAFLRNWPYEYGSANDHERSRIVGKVGVAPLPAGDVRSAASLGGWTTGISNYSKHKKEAWEFLKFLCGMEGQKIAALEISYAPTIKSLYKDKDVLKANPFFGLKGFTDALDSAIARPVVEDYSRVSDIMQINISKAISGEISIEEAVATMDKQLKEALRK